MAHATKTAIEKVEKHPKPESLFVSAEHFLEDWAKYTQDVAKRAFEIFNERGQRFGHDFEDWLKAESELTRRVPIEIQETETNLEIRAQVPGFTADNLKVSVERRRFTLKGEAEAKSERKSDGTIYSEWKSDKIFRTFVLPSDVDAEKAVAAIKNGVLTLTIPKLPEAKPNEVKVNPDL
jgi:HSP20 family protein